MVGLGAPTSPDSELANRQHRVHVNDLWAEFQAFVHTTTSVAYLAKLPVDNPFVDWSIEQRYAADGEVLERTVQCHHAGAVRVLKLLEQAKVDGVVW